MIDLLKIKCSQDLEFCPIGFRSRTPKSCFDNKIPCVLMIENNKFIYNKLRKNMVRKEKKENSLFKSEMSLFNIAYKESIGEDIPKNSWPRIARLRKQFGIDLIIECLTDMTTYFKNDKSLGTPIDYLTKILQKKILEKKDHKIKLELDLI